VSVYRPLNGWQNLARCLWKPIPNWYLKAVESFRDGWWILGLNSNSLSGAGQLLIWFHEVNAVVQCRVVSEASSLTLEESASLAQGGSRLPPWAIYVNPAGVKQSRHGRILMEGTLKRRESGSERTLRLYVSILQTPVGLNQPLNSPTTSQKKCWPTASKQSALGRRRTLNLWSIVDQRIFYCN